MAMTRNTTNIVITGVGGQGVLTLAEVLARAALGESHNVRVGEIHGMAQRGGHVTCSVRIGTDAYGPIIDDGTADVIVGFEPLETLREISKVRTDGFVLMNTYIQHPVAVSMGQAKYPSHDEIMGKVDLYTKNVVSFDAMESAKRAGSEKAVNMVMFGALLGIGLVPISHEVAMETVRTAFSKRFETINVSAVQLGIKASEHLSSP